MSESIVESVAGETMHSISSIRDTEGNRDQGNMLRRLCEYGGVACKAECILAGDYFDNYAFDTTSREIVGDAIAEKTCADMNLRSAIRKLGLKPEEVLMVGVTDSNVGFADEIPETQADIIDNRYGWKELPGYDAFFSRTSEVSALGRRLADCVDLNFEFEDSEGQTVFGFEHGTRSNMTGSSAYRFEKDGQHISFTEYTLRNVIEHYGTDPKSIHIKLAAAIQGSNFTWNFDSAEKMEKYLPGWREDGFLVNATNPDWKAGDPILETDTWEADTRRMIERDINEAMQNLDIPHDNLDTDGAIDPAETSGVHSSFKQSAVYGDSRDLYITYKKHSQ